MIPGRRGRCGSFSRSLTSQRRQHIHRSGQPRRTPGCNSGFIDKPCSLVPGYTWPCASLPALQMYLQVPGVWDFPPLLVGCSDDLCVFFDPPSVYLYGDTTWVLDCISPLYSVQDFSRDGQLNCRSFRLAAGAPSLPISSIVFIHITELYPANYIYVMEINIPHLVKEGNHVFHGKSEYRLL